MRLLTQNPSRRVFLGATGSILLAPASAFAGAEPYALDKERSVVGFTYRFQGTPVEGRMPVAAANISLDLDQVNNSTADVTLDVKKADAGFIFATQTMLGERVLHADRFPTMAFSTTRFSGDLSGAEVLGDLTVKGVTRTVILSAGLFRQRGTEVGDRSRLSVLLEGTIDRRDYGADGWASYVDPDITLRILVRLNRIA